MNDDLRELLMLIITERLRIGKKKCINYFDNKPFKVFMNNEKAFDSILKYIDLNLDTEKCYLDAFKTTKFEFKNKKYILLNIYGQEDCWEDGSFDVCLLKNKCVFIGHYSNRGVQFFMGVLPKEYKLFFGKRAYYFNNQTQEFLIRCEKANYKKLPKENKNEESEGWASGPHCKIFVNNE